MIAEVLLLKVWGERMAMEKSKEDAVVVRIADLAWQ